MLKETYFNQYKGWGMIIPKDAIQINVMRTYGSILSPSYSLLNDWKDKKLSWENYTERFIKEIQSNPEALKYMTQIKELSKNKDVYLICACYNKKKQCHRFILIEMINNLDN